ncbi:MAG: methyl-accepting chemotaxis protein [Bacteroidales bacterium]|nr:methyl-accepting chemotaxis protein [Bacteroidales bacterium]MCM1416533.1 methyl-accepting chemotaxis protein [bacterium]MCM1424530.1 methyl-accepting chemotaxis protein [bacterium]
MKQKSEKNVFQSVKTKIVGVMFLAMTIMAVCLSVVLIRNLRIPLMDLNKNYLYDLVVAYGAQVQEEISMIGYNTATEYNTLSDSIGDVGISGVSSSYAYLVAEDGTMLYHPTKEKVGEPVENVVVKGVVEELQAGNVPGPEIVEYEFKGAIKYAAYYVTPKGHAILVVSADKDELMQTVHRVTLIGTICTIVMVLIASFIGFLIVNRIVNPVIEVTEIVSRLAHMDFSEIEGQARLTARKDETGQMSRAVAELRGKLAEMVTELKGQSEQLFEASDTLRTNATETATTVEQVEKAVSDISDGASSQADETQKATENVILMGNMVEETTREVEEMIANARSMQQSSEEAFATLQKLAKINDEAREAIDVIYEQTNTTNESAMKIREATSLITSIAEETNLLSLNASIEAARAGEQGRGFAVVAGQIQKLAEQSNDSARQIENIIDSLIEDSQKSVKTMEDVKRIMESQNESVKHTDTSFRQVGEGIRSSMEGVNRISDKTRKLDDARVVVVDVVQNLTAIAEENAASTEETSASVTEVSSIVSNISDNANSLRDVADRLEKNMEVFKI